jgi:membrane protein implicated in regulation of membrane protease activity
MTWLYWLVLGLALAALELATPGGFFVIFFSVSALILGILEVVGVLSRDVIQWFLFPVIALVGLGVFRKPLLVWMRAREPKTEVDALIGEVALAAGDIAPGAHGRAELRGTSWSARNVGTAALAAGQRSRVVAVNGLELDIQSE